MILTDHDTNRTAQSTRGQAELFALRGLAIHEELYQFVTEQVLEIRYWQSRSDKFGQFLRRNIKRLLAVNPQDRCHLDKMARVIVANIRNPRIPTVDMDSICL